MTMKILAKLILGMLILLLVAACTSPQGELPPSPSPTIKGAVLPSPTPTSIPTPTPTATPQELIDDGDYALFVGDYQKAYEIFRESLKSNPDADIQAKSNLGMGQAHFMQGIYSSALNHLRQAASAEDPIIAARAHYYLGKTFTQLERYEEALAAYDTYLQLRPGVIDSHVYELMGDLFTTVGDTTQAIDNYETAYQKDPAGGSDSLALKIAAAYKSQGDLDEALVLYNEIYQGTNNDYTKASVDLLIGRIYLELEEPEQAYAYFQDAVNNFPFTYDSYAALVTLVNDGVPVHEYQRGLINYYMGNYGLAIEAFDRYLDSGVEQSPDAALYHKALATRAQGLNDGNGDYQQAIILWQQLIQDYPTSPYFLDAWEDIEYTQWAYMDEPQLAAETALTFVAQRPESPESPGFLFLAGRSYERADLLTEAASTWERMADEYPTSPETFRGVYYAGIAYVRLGDWDSAQVAFSRALLLTSQPAEIAAANLWIGKCQEARGDLPAGLDSWKTAQTADPFGHYSIRAEDLLIGREPIAEPDTYDLDPDLSLYIQEAESWLRSTFNFPADTNLESPGLLANDMRFQRGLEYWSLGFYEKGKIHFDSLRLEYENDPAQTFRLIPALVEIGLYRSALVASTNLLKSAGLEGADALEAPEFFSRVRFGAYYLDWLLPIAESERISPLLLLSIIRQESTYEGFISSGAGARGLMQIIPSTGAQLADELQWPENYTDADLNRPNVSLLFGAVYLEKQRNYFNGDLFAMLAAYNGGPGNTIAWKGLTPFDDPDLFLEVVRIEETRNYIRLINEIHYIYRWLYGSPMDPF